MVARLVVALGATATLALIQTVRPPQIRRGAEPPRRSLSQAQEAIAALEALQPTSSAIPLPLSVRKGAATWFDYALTSTADESVPAVLKCGRAAARAMFEEGSIPLPARKQEAWRYTNLRPMWACTGETEVKPVVRWGPVAEEALAVRVVDGVIEGEGNLLASDEAYVGSVRGFFDVHTDAAVVEALTGLPEAAYEATLPSRNKALGAEPWTVLNAACAVDALIIWAKPGFAFPRRIAVEVTSTTAKPTHPRCVVALGAGAKCALGQSFTGGALTNARTTLRLGQGAELDHASVVLSGGVHVEHCAATLDAGARYGGGVISFDADLARIGVDTTLVGRGARCDLRAIQLGGRRQALDYRTQVRHEAPSCESTQDIRNVVGDKAHVTFKGRIHVPQAGDETAAQQLCRSLLLSDEATLDAMPSLEIVASNVKCTHGATVSDLDDDMEFYLRSRGLDAKTAKALLLRGFCVDIIDAIDATKLLPTPVRSTFEAKLNDFFLV